MRKQAKRNEDRPLRWPACNAGYEGPLPRPMILDTNVLDMLILTTRIIPSI